MIAKRAVPHGPARPRGPAGRRRPITLVFASPLGTAVFIVAYIYSSKPRGAVKSNGMRGETRQIFKVAPRRGQRQ